MNKKYWTAQEVVELKKMYESGASLKEMADRFSINVYAVSKTLTRNGVPRVRKVSKHKGATSWTNKMSELQAHVTYGCSIESLSDLFLWAKTQGILITLDDGSLSCPVKDRLCHVTYMGMCSFLFQQFGQEMRVSVKDLLRKINEVFVNQGQCPITVNGITEY